MAQEKKRTGKVRKLNDKFRKDPSRPLWMLTAGVSAQGRAFVAKAIAAVKAFDAFTEENDPHGEHDFGSFELDGYKVFWKIDSFEKGSNHEAGAETPDDVLTTDRVLTIMLAEEY
jgi:hypothetical protein